MFFILQIRLFTDTLLNIVTDLHKKGKCRSKTDQNPALQFIILVCAVLELDHHVKDDIQVITD